MKPSLSILALACVLTTLCNAQTGSIHEPVRYMGGIAIDPRPHDGRLRPPVGATNVQVLRVNRTNPEMAEDYGWTYNHAPMIAYWNDTFYVQYLSNPVDEHIAPGHTLVSMSKDGLDWGKPVVVFPHYEPPPGTPMPEGATGYMMHQRMGFYVAPNGRLLVLAFYGHTESPFGRFGIGRVVREAYTDGTFGPIYFIRYSSHADWNESNTSYPFYTRSEDTGFVEACDALLDDKLMTLQWWDEDRGLDGFYQNVRGGSALSYYHRADGALVALWKRSTAALSFDGGLTFSDPAKCRTFVMAGGKQWGQRTDDGRYAIAYNPIEMDEHRYPLVVVTGDNGIHFDNMLVVHGEVPPRRFMGRWKDFGPNYTRGIVEGNGNPPEDALWLTYSVNKEDIWVSRVPTPVVDAVSGPVHDTFDDAPVGGVVTNWNIYSPKWAPVGVAAVPSDANKSLRFEDHDPYDYAKAVRVFEEGTQATVSFSIMAEQNNTGMIDIELLDRFGNRPVRLRMDNAGNLRAMDGHAWRGIGHYAPEQWITVGMTVATQPERYFQVTVDGEVVLERAALTEDVYSVERLSFRTGDYREHPFRTTENQDPASPLPGADDPVPAAVFYVDEVQVRSE
jgi:hypothetical protein